MKEMNNNLDERQEKQLLHIERNGCWFAFWALLISIFVQQSLFGITEIRAVAGEWIIFMVLALYLSVSCLKNGIWDRHLKANTKTNFIVSVVAAILFSAVFSIVNYLNYQEWPAAVTIFFVMSISIFVLCFAALSITAAMYNKRVKKLEEASED
ncbi:MAG: DUF6773 family protein [Lachnospiraceae bacterium]